MRTTTEKLFSVMPKLLDPHDYHKAVLKRTLRKQNTPTLLSLFAVTTPVPLGVPVQGNGVFDDVKPVPGTHARRRSEEQPPDSVFGELRYNHFNWLIY